MQATIASLARLSFTAIVQDLLDRLPERDVDAPKDKAVPRLAVGGGCRRRSSFEGDRFIAEKKCPSSAVRRLLRDDDGAGGSTIELRERSGH